MKNRKIIVAFCLLVSFLFVSSAYAARMPKEKNAQRVVQNYFHRYGHKFKESEFGRNKIEYVRILDMEEIHKHLVAIEAEIKFIEGPIVNVRCNLNRKTLGWKLVTWEKL